NHVVPDALEASLLASYDPYGTAEGPDVAAARREMADSRYDGDRDGRCDAAACAGIRFLEAIGPFGRMGPIIRENLGRIGIGVTPSALPGDRFFGQIANPRSHTALSASGWGTDYLDASGYLSPLFSSETLEGSNYSLLGASAEQLAGWGYQTREVPSVDERIGECLPQVGPPETECWAALDQYLTENVVPLVPLWVDNGPVAYPARVVAHADDVWSGMPALDRVLVRPA
ncbi:MAG: hypothetical protein LC722_07525, partial [Actinobacteria bacterium]|nr:hypothetical protein [Actinomycetota bacterium]